MKIQRFICVLLAVLLLAGFVGCVSGEDIGRVDISITAPETGDKPATSATVTQSTKVTVEDITWSPTVSDTFNAATQYTVTIELDTTSGNKFTTSPTVKVNSGSATVKSITSNNRTATITYTFSTTDAAKEVSEIEIESLESPKPSAKADTTATVDSDEGTTALEIKKITWSDADTSSKWDYEDDYFLLDKEYIVKIEVVPKSKEYKFASSVTAKIGTITLESSEIVKSGDKVTLTYKYPETEPLGYITSMNLGVNAPSVGKSTSSTVNTNSNMFTANAIWSPSGTFQPDTSYTVTVTVNAKYGYLMGSTSAISAKVNGNVASVERISDTQARVTYTFGQITSVDTVSIEFAAPASGEKAQTSTSSVKSNAGTTNSATIKWTPQLTSEGTFDSGVEYTAEVTFSVAGNVAFDKNTIVKINGNTATVQSVSTDGKSITATYAFPKTSFIPNPIEIIKEFFNLMKLMINPANYF